MSTIQRAPTKGDCRVLAEAVQQWYRFYKVAPEDHVSNTLVSAALDFFSEGYQTTQDVATMLIGTYVGICSTRVNAPTSASVH